MAVRIDQTSLQLVVITLLCGRITHYALQYGRILCIHVSEGSLFEGLYGFDRAMDLRIVLINILQQDLAKV
jgi:hypothetical protein